MLDKPADTSTETTGTERMATSLSDEKWDNATWSHDNSGNEWSVGALVAYANKHGKRTTVPIDDISHNFVPDPTDNPPSPEEHKARVGRANLEYPIVVVRMPDGKLCIADGFHRAEKVMSLGHTHIEAYVIDYDMLPSPDIQNTGGHGSIPDLSSDINDALNRTKE